MFLLKYTYYAFEIVFLFFINLNTKNFLIFSPRYFSFIFKRVLIFNIKKKKFFLQKVRNFFDINTVYQIFGYEEYNLNRIYNWKKIISEFYNKNSKKSIIFDCGSNIGSSSRYFSEIYPKAKIISVEPDIDNFYLAKKNINLSKTFLIKNAVASSNFNYDVKKKKDPRAHQIKLNKKSTNNKTLTIKDLLKDNKRFKPFIIKIDIEGFEDNLFKKNIKWMNDFKVIIIEIHDWMIPSGSFSSNFVISLAKILKKNKRGLIIQGENLISIRIN